MKILAVDDDADLLALVGFALTQAGYAVVKAPDVRSALRLFAAESPDLAILDINLPDGSGFGICEAIRAQSRIPVMMLTARGEEEDLVKALELGADDYLTKPFGPRTLLGARQGAAAACGTRSGRRDVGGEPEPRSRGAHPARW
jgi:DNA-binding response OmpR family regulator